MLKGVLSKAAKGVAGVTSNLLAGVVGKGVAGAAGTAGAVVTAFFTAFDITTAILNMADNLGDIGTDSKDLISALEYMGGKENNEFKQLMDQVITKLAGGAYEVEKLANEVKTIPLPNVKDPFSKESIDSLEKSSFCIDEIAKNYQEVNEALDILKKKETRDLYIKYSEGILGSIGRGVDYARSKVQSLFGLLDEDKVGENITGELNIYNNTMKKVENFEIKLNKIMAGLEPIRKMLEQYQKQMEDVKQDIAQVTSAVGDDKDLWESVKAEVLAEKPQDEKESKEQSAKQAAIQTIQLAKQAELSFNNFMKAAKLMLS
jgi:hypothetical protein